MKQNPLVNVIWLYLHGISTLGLATYRLFDAAGMAVKGMGKGRGSAPQFQVANGYPEPLAKS